MIRRYRQTDWQSVTEIYLQCKPAEFAGEAFAEKGLVILPLQDNLPARRQFFASDVFVCERDKQVVGLSPWKRRATQLCRQQLGMTLLLLIMLVIKKPLIKKLFHPKACILAGCMFVPARRGKVLAGSY
ncbi:hypothetical protein ACUYOF_05065 [Photobacterium ganghwense]|uniref:hypothetical protein n=1 Tax=Photobacterium ganghwense TaxID=320778 RepID=UPI004056A8E1